MKLLNPGVVQISGETPIRIDIPDRDIGFDIGRAHHPLIADTPVTTWIIPVSPAGVTAIIVGQNRSALLNHPAAGRSSVPEGRTRTGNPKEGVNIIIAEFPLIRYRLIVGPRYRLAFVDFHIISGETHENHPELPGCVEDNNIRAVGLHVRF